MAKRQKKQAVVVEEQKVVEPVIEETPVVEETVATNEPIVEEAPVVEKIKEESNPVVEFDITEPKPSKEAIEEVEQEEARSKQKPSFLITLQVRDLHKFEYSINGKRVNPRGYVNAENLAVKEALLKFAKANDNLNESFDLRIYSNGSIWIGSFDDINHLKGLVSTINDRLIVPKGVYACVKMHYQR